MQIHHTRCIHVLNATSLAEQDAFQQLVADVKSLEAVICHRKKPKHHSDTFDISDFKRIRKDSRTERRRCLWDITLTSSYPTFSQSYATQKHVWFSVTLADGVIINVCACYHGPKPIYDVALFRQHLLNSAASILDDDPDCIFILKGDLNKLNTSEMQAELGLDHIIRAPTYNNNVLDRPTSVTNWPDLFSVSVGQSLIKTKHQTLIVNANGEPDISTGHAPRKFIRYGITLSTCLLCQAFASYNWSGLNKVQQVVGKIKAGSKMK